MDSWLLFYYCYFFLHLLLKDWMHICGRVVSSWCQTTLDSIKKLDFIFQVCVCVREFLIYLNGLDLKLARSYQLDGIKEQATLEPHVLEGLICNSSLILVWKSHSRSNKTHLSQGPVSLFPCLKSRSPSGQTSEYIVLRHNHTWQLLIPSPEPRHKTCWKC